jgi:hypothetical protein
MDHGKSERSMIRRNDCTATGFAGDLFLGAVGMDQDEIAVDSPRDQIAPSVAPARTTASRRKKTTLWHALF